MGVGRCISPVVGRGVTPVLLNIRELWRDGQVGGNPGNEETWVGQRKRKFYLFIHFFFGGEGQMRFIMGNAQEIGSKFEPP